MPVCDHFIYTSAKTETKEGYQVVARSSGISDELLSNLHSYLYPIGLDLQKFQESRSLIVLKNDMVAYSIVKNIGAGYDTRKGTLYNHTFVLSRSDFKDLENDSRLLDEFFILDPTRKKELQKIKIEFRPIPIRFEPLMRLDLLSVQYLLYHFFQRHRIALLDEGENVNLIQNLLACLPPSLRLISFSTLVNDPEKQNEYRIIQISKYLNYRLAEAWTQIELSASHAVTGGMRNIEDAKDFEYLATLIHREDKRKLRDLHQTFENTPGTDAINKIRFLTYKDLLDSSRDKFKRAEYAYECAKAARYFDTSLAAQYLRRARQYSIDAKATELLARIEIGELALLIEKETLHPKVIENILDSLPGTDKETRAIVLSKILEAKASDSPNELFALLKDTISSQSFYKDELLRVFVLNEKLNKFVIRLFAAEGSGMTRHQYYDLFEKFVQIGVSCNFSLVNELFSILDLDLTAKEELSYIKSLVYLIYSVPGVREDAPLEIILDVTKKITHRFDSALDRLLVKDASTGKLSWNSKLDFEGFKHASFDIMHEILLCVRYMADYRKDLNKNMRSSFLDEITQIESLLAKLESIAYRKPIASSMDYQPPTWLDLWLSWFGIKR